MISEKIAESINHQINREIYSAYFYLGMAAYADSANLKGVAHWFKSQVKEELFHAEKMYDYVNQQGRRVNLEAIEQPPQDFSSAADLFEKTLAHEKKVTQMIHGLVELAKAENDTQTQDFLQWFVKEQVEEEATPAGILKNMNLKGQDGKGVSEINEQLAKRK